MVVEVREEERRNEEGTERVFVGRGRAGEGLALSTGGLGGGPGVQGGRGP